MNDVVSKTPTLYVVATPIGNLRDMTTRAVETLREVRIIAAEDTRTAHKLLSLFNISGPELISYYDGVEKERSEKLVKRMLDDEISAALISESGTPCISDPGFRLVSLCTEKGIPVVPIGGISAPTTLISVSPLYTGRYMFVGFLPERGSELNDELESWEKLPAATVVVFFEALRRLRKTLTAIKTHYPNAKCTIGRELTKLHEEIVTLSIDDAIAWTEHSTSSRGESTIVVLPNHNPDATNAVDRKSLERKISDRLKSKIGLKQIMQEFRDTMPRNELYALILDIKDRNT